MTTPARLVYLIFKIALMRRGDVTETKKKKVKVNNRRVVMEGRDTTRPAAQKWCVQGLTGRDVVGRYFCALQRKARYPMGDD